MTCEPGRTCNPLGVVGPATKRIQAQIQLGYKSILSEVINCDVLLGHRPSFL